MAKDRNTPATNATGWVNAYPNAGPINGAVHGVATKTANAPLVNDEVSVREVRLPAMRRTSLSSFSYKQVNNYEIVEQPAAA